MLGDGGGVGLRRRNHLPESFLYVGFDFGVYGGEVKVRKLLLEVGSQMETGV
jgi:hypothetical protein